nr:DUF1971 domain-containing protein [Psychrobacter sp. PraFG1]UTT87722.1 DUF1971 domain-containing protein [Psychrobacter sp. PraFG1]
MSPIVIPSHWRVKRSTPFFTKDNIPPALLTHHNTAAGIYGQICVMQGTVTFLALLMKLPLSLRKNCDSGRPVCSQSTTVLAPD